jgi:hypothetical protein
MLFDNGVVYLSKYMYIARGLRLSNFPVILAHSLSLGSSIIAPHCRNALVPPLSLCFQFGHENSDKYSEAARRRKLFFKRQAEEKEPIKNNFRVKKNK